MGLLGDYVLRYNGANQFNVIAATGATLAGSDFVVNASLDVAIPIAATGGSTLADLITGLGSNTYQVYSYNGTSLTLAAAKKTLTVVASTKFDDTNVTEASKINIPAAITIGSNSYKVTAIASGAFNDVISGSLINGTTGGNSSVFIGITTNIQTIGCKTDPNFVTLLNGDDANHPRTYLNIFAAGENTKVADNLFDGLLKIDQLVLDKEITEIGKEAFKGVFFDYMKSNLKSNSATSYPYIFGITTIGEGAFQNADLRGVVSNGYGLEFDKSFISLETIGDNAFAGVTFPSPNFNTPKTDIALPASLTKIGKGAFAGAALTVITIPASVTSIGENAIVNVPVDGVTIGAGSKLTVDDLVVATGKAVEALTAVNLFPTKVTIAPSSADYTGEAQKPTVTVTYSSANANVNVPTSAYTVSWEYKSNAIGATYKPVSELIDAGTYLATIKGVYDGKVLSAVKAFTISPCTLR